MFLIRLRATIVFLFEDFGKIASTGKADAIYDLGNI
jgi:hypothetical protein